MKTSKFLVSLAVVGLLATSSYANIGENTLIGAGATATKHIGSNKALHVAKPFLRESKR